MGRRRKIEAARRQMSAIAEAASEKQAFKLKLLADLYRAEFAFDHAALLHWVRARPGLPEIVVALTDGRRIRDAGAVIRLQGRHDQAAVQLMVAMALAKGWSAVTTSGDEQFRTAVRAEGHRLGLTVDGVPFPLSLSPKIRRLPMLTEMERALIAVTREHWQDNARRHDELTRQLDELSRRLDALTSVYTNLVRLLTEEFDG